MSRSATGPHAPNPYDRHMASELAIAQQRLLLLHPTTDAGTLTEYTVTSPTLGPARGVLCATASAEAAQLNLLDGRRSADEVAADLWHPDHRAELLVTEAKATWEGKQ